MNATALLDYLLHGIGQTRKRPPRCRGDCGRAEQRVAEPARREAPEPRKRLFAIAADICRTVVLCSMRAAREFGRHLLGQIRFGVTLLLPLLLMVRLIAFRIRGVWVKRRLTWWRGQILAETGCCHRRQGAVAVAAQALVVRVC